MTEHTTAQKNGLAQCLSCTHLVDAKLSVCPHCNHRISIRKPHAQQLGWIYLITSIILFFPANLLPISYASRLGQPTQADTIFSSIIGLWNYGSYAIAIIIFLASIFTPFFKIAVLLYLLTHGAPQKPPVLQTKLYKIIHFVGRWSMIDVFVVGLLAALIHGNLATISPGPGIFAFAAVVIFTILATEHYDIRLIWDRYREYSCNHQK